MGRGTGRRGDLQGRQGELQGSRFFSWKVGSSSMNAWGSSRTQWIFKKGDGFFNELLHGKCGFFKEGEWFFEEGGGIFKEEEGFFKAGRQVFFRGRARGS